MDANVVGLRNEVSSCVWCI